MYKEFFGLKADPFTVNPDPRFLFLTRHAHEALAALTYGIQTRKGFLLLTGEVGTGKTTLINRLLEWLHKQQVTTAFVFNSSLNVPEFLDFMTVDFGLDCQGLDKSRILLKLNSWLLEKYREGKTVALVVDEAQNLSMEVLEEIRMLTNLETATAKLLQIVLSGQPELEEKLRKNQLRQLNQRITLRSKTHPLTMAETANYIATRVKIAGGNNMFSIEACEKVWEFSNGIPRVINLLCEHALISAYVDQQRTISAPTIEVVAQEFELDARPPAMQKSATVPVEQQPGMAELVRQIEVLNKRLRDMDMEKTATTGGK